MQALMLAAGMGKRLGKYTGENTKCMLEVAGKKLIDHAIDAAISVGIKKFILVIGYKGENVRAHIMSNYSNTDMEFVFIENNVYDKTNNIYSLYLAKDVFKEDDTILLESDLIYEPTIIQSMINDPFPNLVAVDLYESWMDGTVVNIDESKVIIQFIEKKDFDFSNIDSYYKTVNIYKFSKDFINNEYLPFLNAYINAYGENEYYETVLKAIAHLSRSKLRAFVLSGQKWYEIDDAQDYDIAETMFSKGKSRLNLIKKKFGGYWRYSGMLDFCYLVNPYFPSPHMVHKMINEYEVLLRQYPSGLSIQNLNAGRMFDVDSNMILVSNGAAEIINVLHTILKGDIALSIPTFNEYVRCFKNNKFIKLDTSSNNYKLDTKKMLANLKQADAMVVINPDNPSGAFIPYDDIITLIEECKSQNKIIVVDESFVDFADRPIRYTLLKNSILNSYPNLIVIKSISKSYGVPGLRLGVVATSNLDTIAKLSSALPVWNINSFAEYFLQIINLYLPYYWVACDKIAEERAYLSAAISRLGCTVYPSQANYIMLKLPNGITSEELTEELLEHYNIFIKDLHGKEAFDNQHVRIAVRDRNDNCRLIEAIEDTLSKWNL